MKTFTHENLIINAYDFNKIRESLPERELSQLTNYRIHDQVRNFIRIFGMPENRFRFPVHRNSYIEVPILLVRDRWQILLEFEEEVYKGHDGEMIDGKSNKWYV